MARRAYLKGLPELRKKLEKLKTGTADKIRPAMEQGAQATVDMMKRLAPVDDGDLRDSIAWTWGTAPSGSISIAKARAGENTMTIYAGNDQAYHARWIEFGTAPHVQGGQFKGTRHPGTAPQPFFYPSWRANKKQFNKLLRDAIRKAVKEAVA